MPEALPVTAGAALQLVQVDPAAEAVGHVGAGMDDVDHFLPDPEQFLFNQTVASGGSNE